MKPHLKKRQQQLQQYRKRQEANTETKQYNKVKYNVPTTTYTYSPELLTLVRSLKSVLRGLKTQPYKV